MFFLSSPRNWILILLFIVVISSILLRERVGDVLNTDRTLVVYTYSSFAASWGPGPKIEAEFERLNDVDLKFLDVGDAGLILQRLRFLPDERVDVVLGLDQLYLKQAEASLKWRALDGVRVTMNSWLKETGYSPFVQSRYFVPYDWSPLAFVGKAPALKGIRNLQALLNEGNRGKISMSDPRLSSTGLQFISWLVAVKGREKAIEFLKQWSRVKPKIGNSWSVSYGLYQKGLVDLTFSYLTSPLYHWTEEQDRSHQTAVLEDPSPFQIEYMAIPDRCQNCRMAEKFVSFMLKPEIQTLVMNLNYMFPVIDGLTEKALHSELPKVKLLQWEQVSQQDRAELLKVWEEAFP